MHLMNLNTPIEICLSVQLSWLGKPYTWGGDDPMAGFDCSGLQVEGLKAAGIIERGADYTAQGLMELFPIARRILPGCLLYWGQNGRATHVEMAIRVMDPTVPRVWTIGASGGGRRVRTLEDAIKHNAFVKIRPARPGWIRVNDPFAEMR